MLKNLPIFEIGIDLNDQETSVSFNSLVLNPAHEISFQTFSNVKRFEFNEEEQIITGIAISCDTPIYRFDSDTGMEYYVSFPKQAIKDIIHDYARRGNFNNVNLEHNGQRVVDGIYMVHSYQIDNEKGFTAPERFKDANDGSWITSYKVTNKEIFEAAKKGEFTGFSIEGTFVLEDKGDTMESEMMSEIFKALDQLKQSFAKKRISFDFDDTLTTTKGQEMVKRFLNAGDEIFIITARQQSNGSSVFEMAKKLGIKAENVHFTGGKDKWMTVKRLRIDKHIDNNEEQLQLIRDNTTAEAWKI
ncbi:Phage-like element PBSX protein, XkdF [uncultured Caudovirales phage]|uniref:Phage-like element PBSX protein, XkdF n=1 Tax=uncultured Caudovirales phage TaxID=2100421 RepID=A0A6J5N6Z6_9CAUD|nr:Phage-like element PBSX protein, XkdF [uncultured Caudovirales phage]